MVGAAGLLGAAVAAHFEASGHAVRRLTRAEIDLEERASVDRALVSPGAIVVNAAAWTDVDGCALDPSRAERINGRGAGWVAAAAARAGAVTVHIGTNEVFDGEEERAYTESDTPRPINPYGASKLAGERAVADAGAHVIVRTAWLFDATRGFPARIAAAADRAVATGTPLRVVDDEFGNPTWVGDLAAAIVRLSERCATGAVPTLLHLAGEPATSRLAWARTVLPPEAAAAIVPIRSAEYARPSRVPRHAVLATDLARRLGLDVGDWRAHAPHAASARARGDS